MPRLFVVTEGQTEEQFVAEVLGDHLISLGFHSVQGVILGNAKSRRSRGGILSWGKAKHDILLRLKQDPTCFVTTMVDYYGLPSRLGVAWPGRAEAAQRPLPERALFVEGAILSDVSEAMGKNFNPSRFIPFVLMHEFEAILFSDCAAFGRATGQQQVASAMQRIAEQFHSPEEINDSPESAPSKRILSLWPEYDKPTAGSVTSLEIGLPAIRLACPHFNNWLTRLESLV